MEAHRWSVLPRKPQCHIDPALTSLSYTQVEQDAQAVLKLGPGTDVKSAFQVIPIHPDDRPLLGILAALPFGLYSAPRLFNILVDALKWIAKRLGIEFLWHYLDNFITRHGGVCLFLRDRESWTAQHMSSFLGTSQTTGREVLTNPLHSIWVERKTRCTQKELQSLVVTYSIQPQ